MSAISQFEEPQAEELVNELRLLIEELRASSHELRAHLADRGAGGDGAAAAAPALPASLSAAELWAESARVRRQSHEIVQASLVMRMRRSTRTDHDGSGNGKPAGETKGLSKREREVLALIVAGRTSKQIAAALGISFKTAVTHRTSIMDKLEVHEIASLVREAIRQRLV